MGSGLNKKKYEIVSLLRDHGFELRRTTGRHEVWYNSQTNKSVCVPQGGNSKMDSNVVRNIYRFAGIPYTEKQKNGHFETIDAANIDDTCSPSEEIVSEVTKRNAVNWANENDMRSACKRFDVGKEIINQWRSEIAQEDNKNYAERIAVSRRKALVVHTKRILRRYKRQAVKDEAKPVAAAAPAVIAIDPEHQQKLLKIAYMRSQGVSEAVIRRMYGIAARDADDKPKEIEEEKKKARQKIDALQEKIQMLREENEKLKKHIKILSFQAQRQLRPSFVGDL